MKNQVILATLLMLVCFAALMVCSRAATASHVASTAALAGADISVLTPLVERAASLGNAATHLLIGAMPFFGILVGQAYRHYRKQKTEEK